VCYGNGGEAPTVTDADLLLGHLNPDFFLGGEMQLRLDEVRTVVASQLGGSLGLDVTAAARGMRHIVNENMAAATRMHLAEKGRDPREYTLVAFGGAGPVHAYELAKLLKLRRVVVPPGAGVASALGFLVAAPGTDAVRGYVARLDAVDWAHISALYAEMETGARKLLEQAGAEPEEISIRASADMRHVGQGFEILVPLPPGPLGPDSVGEIRRAFFATYARLFDRTIETVPIEALNWRMHASAPGREIRIAAARPEERRRARQTTSRRVWIEPNGWTECPVHDRYALGPGDRLSGPAVIEERESTCVIGADASMLVDAQLNLVIEIENDAGDRSRRAHG
jgi:N-methylhydantoinase A